MFAFPHRTFQEYLAGAHLVGLKDCGEEALKLAEQDLALHRELLLLAVGKQVHVDKAPEHALYLVGLLCPPGISYDVHAWHLAILAGEVLAEIGVSRACARRDGPELRERVTARLLALIEEEKLPARDRARAGDVLCAIGDPRFRDASGWCLPADEMLGFVEIPAGPFLMGSDKKRDGQASDDEKPQHKVELPAFLVARFPVTVAQFRVFVQATGMKLGRADGLGMPVTRPIAYVSLDEARGYCAWLDRELRGRQELPAKLRQALERGKVALPSEPEWEKAARGTDGRIYPWGDEWNPQRANVGQTDIGSTSAVGCFTSGKSPHGCEDMGGNVWEWTRSRYQPYPYPTEAKARAKREAPGGEDARVARGGSFLGDQWLVRAACRSFNHPGDRGSLLGFRVVVSPSVSDP